MRKISARLGLAVALSLSAPLASEVLVSPAHAADKDKSPAKQEIADANYVMKELVRLLGLTPSKNVIGMLEGQIKDCEAAVAKVKKKDPAWDIKDWEKSIADAKVAVKKGAEAKPAASASGPDSSKSPASDDIALTKGQLSSLEKKLADKTDWATDKSKRESARTALDGFENGIKRIASKDSAWDLKDWKKILADGRARLKTADDIVAKEEGQAKAELDLYKDYTWKLSEVADAVTLLAQIKAKPGDVKIQSEQIFGNLVKEIAKVEKLDKACKEKKYTSIAVPSYYKSNKPAAAEGCALAAEWKTLGQAYVELQSKGAAKRESERLDKRMTSAKAGESIEAADHKRLKEPTEAVGFFRKPYDAGAKAFGSETKTEWFSPIMDAGAKYPKVMEEAAKTSRWDKAATGQDAGITAGITADHQKGGALDEGKLIKIGAVHDWSVEKDVWNVPAKRTRTTHAMVQIKGETVCRIYARGFTSFFKSGAWSKPTWIMAGSTFKLSACK